MSEQLFKAMSELAESRKRVTQREITVMNLVRRALAAIANRRVFEVAVTKTAERKPAAAPAVKPGATKAPAAKPGPAVKPGAAKAPSIKMPAVSRGKAVAFKCTAKGCNRVFGAKHHFVRHVTASHSPQEQRQVMKKAA